MQFNTQQCYRYNLLQHFSTLFATLLRHQSECNFSYHGAVPGSLQPLQNRILASFTAAKLCLVGIGETRPETCRIDARNFGWWQAIRVIVIPASARPRAV